MNEKQYKMTYHCLTSRGNSWLPYSPCTLPKESPGEQVQIFTRLGCLGDCCRGHNFYCKKLPSYHKLDGHLLAKEKTNLLAPWSWTSSLQENRLGLKTVASVCILSRPMTALWLAFGVFISCGACALRWTWNCLLLERCTHSRKTLVL